MIYFAEIQQLFVVVLSFRIITQMHKTVFLLLEKKVSNFRVWQ